MSAPTDQRRARATSFGAAADAYERGRPTYPDAAVDWMLAGHPARVLDLGAGTGKLTRSLVARGLETVAVDPSPKMLARLAAALPRVETHVGTAEAIPLPDASLDAVVVGQAWHWVDPQRAVPEIARVLRPGGLLALVWNKRDAAVDWVARLDRIVDRGRFDPTYDGAPVVGPPFGALAQHDVAWTHEVDAAGLIYLAGSRSVAILLPPEELAALNAELRALFAEVAGGRDRLAIPYVAHAFRAVLPPAPMTEAP